jgi:hypothetical protein
MIRTKVRRMLALAGFAPAGKPGYANRQERFCSAYLYIAPIRDSAGNLCGAGGGGTAGFGVEPGGDVS